MNESANPAEFNSPHTRDDTSLLAVATSAAHPPAIGRYRIEKVLGEGGFGIVYLAHDDQLNRPVAIKVPRRERISRANEAEAYLAEARVVASLDHPNIVPVHDVGTTSDGLCFVVSKFIKGSDLAHKIQVSRLSIFDSAELVATVAEALHYAHRKGLVHRDIKPANILLDTAGKPFVADFGLALKEEDFGKGANFAGTPAYMSPEQARGEGHRVDGRSDIFSLGVVFYELLTGRRPFPGLSTREILEQIANVEVRPLRQIDDRIPKELERICLKALSKRATERFTTAKDMGDDLRHWIATQRTNHSSIKAEPSTLDRESVAAPSVGKDVVRGEGNTSSPDYKSPITPASDQQLLKIVPKGLRSFDAHDADFFLELLPGPRDREGLPDSLRFWKTRIEEPDPDNTFSVGLIYGPSGCGKSSLIKAGLLPRLSGDVIAVYVEATGVETESRILNGLRKKCPSLAANLDLKETLAALRRGQGIPAGKKVLIVLDQFEQWLHAKKEETNTELVQALRQCNGSRVQCIVMVRDDFWMAATRFMRELEIRLLEGHNSAAVDLFDTDHARKVLAAFGRAFGKLPENASETDKEQKEFLKLAVSGLAQEGKVICVRQALFAEMMKGKSWTPASLKAVGGTEGVGITFLEETFSAATAPPEHRYHQKAAWAVLKSLLPEAGTDIKGHMRSQQELLEASGYVTRPGYFDDLLRILDGEVRLITPTDPEGKEGADPSSIKASAKYFQLTHDYLVPSLRDWLTRKQKETRRGRAELQLSGLAAQWAAFPAKRQLPTLLEWLNIRFFTRMKDWKPTQRKMMQKAGRYHVFRWMVLAVLLAIATATGLVIRGQVVEQRKATQAAGLVQSVLNADTAQVPSIIDRMADYRKWTDPLLRDEYDKATDKSRQKLHASLALLPVDATQVAYLNGRLLDAEPHEVPVIRDALAPHKDALLDQWWAVVEKPEKGKEQQRLRAAAALAKYDPASERWVKAGDLVVNDLVRENPVFLGQWSEALRPVKNRLLPRLSAIFRDHQPERTAERSLATNILADYAADQANVLADLLMDADEKQFAIIYPKFQQLGDKGIPVLTAEIDKSLPKEVPSSDDKREKLAKRQATAGVVLLRMNQPAKVWPLLQHSPDPRVRSYLIHRLSPLGADAKVIVKRLEEEPDITLRRALLLCLGEFSETELSLQDRQMLLPKLQEMYRTASDPGLHAASEWLLRTWGQQTWLKKVNDEWAKDKEQRENRLHEIGKLVAKDKEKTPPQWYVNGQGQTMVVIPGRVEFPMGSPITEAGREDNEIPHRRRIGRTFALASRSVTVKQYRQFDTDYYLPAVYTRTADLPVVGINWHMAAAYCNWLSKKEGLDEDQWCYEIKGEEETKLKKNYLSLSGYRLPTEAEMEFATRAGALTSRYFGETEELLPKYAWYFTNSQEKTWPVGSLKPNDFGLFDVQGNVYAWCQERYKGYPTSQEDESIEDKEDLLDVNNDSRVLRGGSFSDRPSTVRSAFRFVAVPALRIVNSGFRPARTLPLDSFTPLPLPEGAEK